jgi:SAM-dependent methyltransferase
MDAHEWDERYAAVERVWSVEPNRWLEEVSRDLPPGRALDLACGEGRNAVWLADRGWRVTAVDFSTVALDRGRAASHAVEWIDADVRAWPPPPAAFDLVALVYLHLPPVERRAVLAGAAGATAPGATLVVIGHDRRNIAEGVGGPQDPDILLDPAEVTAELRAARESEGDGEGVNARLEVTRAETVVRPTPAGAALDTLVVARHAPATAPRRRGVRRAGG